jgi:hypothetical protein
MTVIPAIEPESLGYVHNYLIVVFQPLTIPAPKAFRGARHEQSMKVFEKILE